MEAKHGNRGSVRGDGAFPMGRSDSAAEIVDYGYMTPPKVRPSLFES